MPRTTKHLPKWQKGQSGNPKGRTPNAAIKALRNLTVETYRTVVEIVLTGDIVALKEMAANESIPAIQVGVARAFLKAIKDGDYGIIERIAERIVGKIPDVVHVNQNTNMTATVAQVTDEVLKERIAKLRSEI
jgi:Family of unknown function (DUF5681)